MKKVEVGRIIFEHVYWLLKGWDYGPFLLFKSLKAASRKEGKNKTRFSVTSRKNFFEYIFHHARPDWVDKAVFAYCCRLFRLNMQACSMT